MRSSGVAPFEVCWLWLCLTGIQCPAPLSPETRPCWATAKASSTSNNGAGLYRGLQQTADCPLVLIHLYSVLSHCCRLSLIHTHIHAQCLSLNSLVVCKRKRKFTGPYVGMYTHWWDSPSLLLSVSRSVSLSADPSPHLSAHHPSFPIHLSLPLPPSSISFAFFLFVFHTDSVAWSPVGPQSVKPTPRSSQTPSCLPQLCGPALPSPRPVSGLFQRCASSIDFLLRTMCECLRGIFRVTWTPSSNAGQDECLPLLFGGPTSLKVAQLV